MSTHAQREQTRKYYTGITFYMGKEVPRGKQREAYSILHVRFARGELQATLDGEICDVVKYTYSCNGSTRADGHTLTIRTPSGNLFDKSFDELEFIT